ncbi:S41 family peptidase [Jeotgalibacillus sp. ET6]|uniref:S41 family peptidase n=1 Tax=Jeotgalibacillus sp. ET6 TaxID=3037260 RepID=UPI0024184C2B|nr:S41 family peptidase [Jeotgalibacillus sp. ET6]MDG5473192.1 S41 family peptidase [Jeotgalibacillus sp. ET6]
MKKFMGIGLLSVALLSGCTQADSIREESLENELVVNRTFEEPPAIAAYLPDFEETEIPELSTDMLQSITEERELAGQLSQEDMVKDLETFLSAMRYGFGPYEFYGGDEAFLAAADEVENWIHSSAEVRSGKEYSKKLRESFSFVEDQHFYIEGLNPFQKEVAPVGVEEWQFTKEENAYFFNSEEVELINNESPKNYIKSSFDEKGELIYFAAAMTQESEEEWTLETDSDTYRAVPFQLTTHSEGQEPFNISETDEGISVVTFRTMMVHEEDFFTYEDMLSAVDYIKEAPAAILDLRNNGGGNGFFSTRFIHDLTGSPPTGTESIWIDTNTNHVLLSTIRELYQQQGAILETFYEHLPPEIYGGYDVDYLPVVPDAGVTTFGTAWAGTDVEISKEPSLDIPLYILMNENTASAAELIIEGLMKYENTILIGSTTSGAFTSDAGSLFFLPHSGVMIGMPSSLSIGPYSYQREGVGIEPDVWISGGGAMERTVKWAESALSDEE